MPAVSLGRQVENHRLPGAVAAACLLFCPCLLSLAALGAPCGPPPCVPAPCCTEVLPTALLLAPAVASLMAAARSTGLIGQSCNSFSIWLFRSLASCGNSLSISASIC